MPKLISLLLVFSYFSLCSQVNLVPNPSFEFTTGCPTGGAQWNLCTSWDNVNLSQGIGLWGTPDFFHTCGSNSTAPPATFAGTCNPHTGNGMMALVIYNTGYADYREYIATPLNTSMQPGTTYTLSFWLSNGTGIKSPYTIANIGVCFSSGALSQSGYAVISATPQCEITSNVVSTGWTNYTFTVNPTAAWDHLTLGAFRTDANNNVTMSFTNPGGPASAYANYFVDDVQLLASNCSFSVNASAPYRCPFGPSMTLTASGLANYTWSPSNSLSSSTGSVVAANPTVTTVYTVTGSSGTCTSTQTFTVQIVGNGNFVNINSAGGVNLCPGAVTSVTASGAVSYTWMPGGTNNPIVTISTSLNTTYTVTGMDGGGCLATETLAVIQNPAPVLNVSLSSPTLCSGSTTTFVASGASLFTLQPGTFTFPIMFNTIIISPSVSTIYTLTGATALGCTANITIPVTVFQTPTLTITPPSQNVCAGSAASFTASGAASYTWQPSSSHSSVLTIPSVSLNTIYTIFGSGGPGCAQVFTTAYLFVDPVPTVNAVSNPTSTCAGGTATLTASGAVSYSWLPGNISGSVNVVNPLTTTIYTVTGYLNTCSSTATVVVANPLSPTISSTGNIDCNNPTPQIFIAANSTSYTILWAGPGIITPLTSSVITANTAGIYSVTLTNTTSNCSAINTISILNTTGPLPISIIPSTTLTCYPGPPINLLTSSSANYTWFPSSLTTPSTGPLVSVNPSVTTTYSVIAMLGICSGSAAVTISVNATPSLVLPAKTLTVCSGQPLTIVAAGALDYNWSPGGIPGPSITVWPLTNTVYTVTGNNYNCYASDVITVIALPSPTILVSASPALICVGDTSTLMASGGDAISWQINGSTVSSSVVSVNPFTSSQFTASGTNSLGCVSSQTVAVTVLSGPALEASASSSLICQNETVSLTVSGAGSYTWMPLNQTGNVITASPSVSTVYTVVADNSGCKSFTVVTVNVQECFMPFFGVANNAEVIKESGDLYRIIFKVTVANTSSQTFTNVTLKDDLTYTFRNPFTFTVIESPTLISHGSALIGNVFYNGESDLNLIAPGISNLAAGKIDTVEFIVMVDPHDFSGVVGNSVYGLADILGGQTIGDISNEGFDWDPDKDGNPTNNNVPTTIKIDPSEFFIPEGFSPDGDGIHDVFMIKGLNGRKVDITVFNRWGNKVYEKENYDNSWNGTPNVNTPSIGHGKLPEGTYYYILQFKDGKKETKTGFVVLRHE